MDWSFLEGLIIGIVVALLIFLLAAWLLIKRIAARMFGSWMAKKLTSEVAKSLQIQRPVIKGKISEQIFPLLYEKAGNLADFRFIGNPVDYVVFDGLSEPAAKITIKFMEVKTGSSKINQSEWRVKEAIQDGRVSWEEITI